MPSSTRRLVTVASAGALALPLSVVGVSAASGAATTDGAADGPRTEGDPDSQVLDGSIEGPQGADPTPDAELRTATPAPGAMTDSDGATTESTEVLGVSLENTQGETPQAPVQASGDGPTREVEADTLAGTGAHTVALAVVALLSLLTGAAVLRRRTSA